MATQTQSTSVSSVGSLSDNQIRYDANTDRLDDMTVRQSERDELARFTVSPTHRLSGAQIPLLTRLAHKLGRLMFNLFPLAVVGGFFWFQVQIDAQNTGLLHTLVTIMSVVVELGVIFVWSLFI